MGRIHRRVLECTVRIMVRVLLLPAAIIAAFAAFGCGSSISPNGAGDAGADQSTMDDSAGGNGRDEGHPSDPHRVHCGNVACPPGADGGCCVELDGGGGRCIDSQHACVAPSASLECDEAANCPPGLVCCYQIGSGAFSLHAVCVPSCPTKTGLGAQTQACRTQAECGDGGSCAVRQCSEGSVLETCGPSSLCQ
jgi:hypothetical protein